MRKVYYIFALRVLRHPITLHIALFVLAMQVFAQMVHVKRIIDTLLHMPVGSTPKYILGAFMHGEMLTLIAIGAMVFVALSFPVQIKRALSLKLVREAVV